MKPIKISPWASWSLLVPIVFFASNWLLWPRGGSERPPTVRKTSTVSSEQLADSEFTMTPDEAFANWQGLKYTDVRSTDFEDKWSKIFTVFGSKISADQHKKFLSDAAAYLKIYASDDVGSSYQHYVAQHHPIGSYMDEKWCADMAKKLGLKDTSQRSFISALFKIDAPTRQIMGICVPASRVHYFAVNKRDSPISPVLEELVTSPAGAEEDLSITKGRESIPRVYKYAYDFAPTYESGKTVLIADLRCYEKNALAGSGIGEPYVWRFWWNDHDREWFPIGLVRANVDSDSFVFLP